MSPLTRECLLIVRKLLREHYHFFPKQDMDLIKS